MLLSAIIEGLFFGLYFTLVGLGLTLVFGVMKIVNIAHGDFLMLGAYGAFWFFMLLGLHPLASAAVMLVVLIGVGIPIYYLIVPRLMRARDTEMLSLILFFGMSQVIEAIVSILFGNTERSIPARIFGVGPIEILGARMPRAWVYSAAVSAVCVVGVYIYLYRTRLGTLTRAVMSSRDEALATGIDIHFVSALAFGIGIALAGVAGAFEPFMLGSVTPSLGVGITITAFAVIVVGTLGNPLG
ncbi:MAG: branched-chain amino acid ABC transporter permease, partial [Acetobacteraceae bacterium]